MPLHVGTALAEPAQEPLSRLTDHIDRRPILGLEAAKAASKRASSRVNTSPDTSFTPIIGVTPIRDFRPAAFAATWVRTMPARLLRSVTASAWYSSAAA